MQEEYDTSEEKTESNSEYIYPWSDFDDFKLMLETSQEADTDQRQKARECINFTTQDKGQWEDDVASTFDDEGRPMYTFDRTTPLIDLIVGKIEQSEFSPKVYSNGDEADNGLAEIRNGMIRAVMNASDVPFQLKRVARKLCHTGFDVLRLRHDYISEESFDQDLTIEMVPNAIDRVWFDPNSEEQDHSDAEWCVVLQTISKERFKKEFGKDTSLPVSVSQDRSSDYYDENKAEKLLIGEVLYYKYENVDISLLSNGDVVDSDDADEAIKNTEDDITKLKVMETRKVKRPKVYSRMFSDGDWLKEERETAFAMLPVIPFYHCFDIIEDKKVWRRIVEKLMDAQRVLNYAKSAQVQQVALTPPEKIVISTEQLDGVEAAVSELNVSLDPIFAYNHVEGQPPPYKLSGSVVNQGLMAIAQDSANDIEAIAGLYAANMAKNEGLQSGVALEIQTERGDLGNSSFFVDLAKGVTRLCQVMNDTFSRVHDVQKKVQSKSEDGTSEYIELNKPVFNEETNRYDIENDMTTGQFTAICRMGPMFTTRRSETRSGLMDLYTVLPETAPITSDIFASTIDSPGMDQATERLRMTLVASGQIPENQLSKEEKAAIQQAHKTQANTKEKDSTDPLEQLMAGQLSVEQFKAQNDAAVDQFKAETDAKLKEAQTRKAIAEAEATELETDMKEAKVIGVLSNDEDEVNAR